MAEFLETHEDGLAALLFFDSTDQEEADLIGDLIDSATGAETTSNDMLDIVL